jgi:hypothetical protein
MAAHGMIKAVVSGNVGHPQALLKLLKIESRELLVICNYNTLSGIRPSVFLG